MFFKIKYILFLFILFTNNIYANSILSINVALKESKTPLIIYNFSGNEDYSRNINQDLIKKISFFPNIKLYKPIENLNCKENSKNIGLTSYCIKSRINKISQENYVLSLSMEYSSSNETFSFEIPFNKNNIDKVSNQITNKIYKKIFNSDTFLDSKIAYVKTLRENGKIWYSLNISDFDMKNEKQILVSPEPITSLSWDKNNTTLAYSSFENIRPAIYTYNILNNEFKKIISIKGINDNPKWSPSGRFLAFSLSKQIASDIYIYDFKENKITNITNRNNSIDTEPEWIDDSNILFTSNRNGNPNIFKVNINNKKVSKINTKYNYVTTPVFDKINNNIISIVNNSGKYGILKTNLNSNQSEIIKVDFYAESPSISSDGNVLYYISKTNNKNHVKVIDINGKSLFNINSRLNIKDIKISN